MAGVFIGQMLYRSRAGRKKKSEVTAWSTGTGSNGEVKMGEPKVAAAGKGR